MEIYTKSEIAPLTQVFVALIIDNDSFIRCFLLCFRYSLLGSCWKQKPSERPSVKKLKDSLQDCDQEKRELKHLNHLFMEKDDYWEDSYI